MARTPSDVERIRLERVVRALYQMDAEMRTRLATLLLLNQGAEQKETSLVFPADSGLVVVVPLLSERPKGVKHMVSALLK